MAGGPGVRYISSMTSTALQRAAQSPDYSLIEAAIDYFQRHQETQPSVRTVADHLGVSDGHLQRLFRKWVGLTPKQFLQSLTVERAKHYLEQSGSLLDTSLAVGLSGPGRLHDHFVVLEAMTPAEYRSLGERLRIDYGQVNTPFGRAFAALTERGICQLGFEDGRFGEDGLGRLRDKWPLASLHENEALVTATLEPVWAAWQAGAGSIRVLVQGSNFQVQVWRALLSVPAGQLVDYSTIAGRIGKPSATRAVASAIGANPVACLIPCHRVIRRDGLLGGYRWGLPRKSMLLARELGAA